MSTQARHAKLRRRYTRTNVAEPRWPRQPRGAVMIVNRETGARGVIVSNTTNPSVSTWGRWKRSR